jgi:hypothetical protein
MREMGSAASRDWLADRASEDDAAASQGPEGKAEIQVDDLAGGGGGFTPVTGGEAPVISSDSDWLEDLRFDDNGRRVLVEGVPLTVESLAKREAGWAQYAADDLVDASSEADKNNRACALAYAKPEDVTDAHEILKGIPACGPIVRDNLKILGRHVFELPS